MQIKEEVREIVSNLDIRDIAFLLECSLKITKQKMANNMAQEAINCLKNYDHFTDLILEFYLLQNKNLRCAAISGVDNETRNVYIGRRIIRGSIIAQSFINNKIIFHTEAEKEPSRRGEFITVNRIKSSLIIPIERLGVITINRFDKKKFNLHHIKFIKLFIDVIKSSLELAIDNEKNFNAAIRDQLTGLYNHGYFAFELKKYIENARRANHNISLIMIDVDYFKKYNDQNGHPKGDELLIKLGKILRVNTRSADIVARYGGEEFAVVLHNAKLKDAVNKAELLRKAVSEYKFYNEESQPDKDLTISLGVSSFPDNADNAEDLVIRADKALYYSKNNGKNKVTSYNKVSHKLSIISQ
ncbi:MAG: sensor domain-containing diguanylate cyclase [Nanoarchaeota archaeon]